MTKHAVACLLCQHGVLIRHLWETTFQSGRELIAWMNIDHVATCFLSQIFHASSHAAAHLRYAAACCSWEFWWYDMLLFYMLRHVLLCCGMLPLWTIPCVITVSCSTWKTKKNMESPPIFLFRCDCTPVKVKLFIKF